MAATFRHLQAQVLLWNSWFGKHTWGSHPHSQDLQEKAHQSDQITKLESQSFTTLHHQVFWIIIFGLQIKIINELFFQDLDENPYSHFFISNLSRFF